MGKLGLPSGIDSSSLTAVCLLHASSPPTRSTRFSIAVFVPALSFKAQSPVLLNITSFSSSVVDGGSHELSTTAHVTRCVLSRQLVLRQLFQLTEDHGIEISVRNFLG